MELFTIYTQDTLSSRAALGRVRRASKGILHTTLPFDIRNSMKLTQFKSKLGEHFWSIAKKINNCFTKKNNCFTVPSYTLKGPNEKILQIQSQKNSL